MGRIKEKIRNMGIKQKLIFYCYLIIAPILLLISTAMVLRNYYTTLNAQAKVNARSVQGLAENIDVLQTDMEDMSTYLYINQDILKILTASDVDELNKDSQLWLNDAPMKMIQDMVALKGYIKTIAIYPENGINPYLKSIDASSYIRDMETVRASDTYKKAIEEKGRVVWRLVKKDSNNTYLSSRSDKLVLYREIFDLTKKEPLGYVIIGAAADKFIDLCETSLQQGEGILVLSEDGEELIRCGELDERTIEYLTGKEFLDGDYRGNVLGVSNGNNNIYCIQKEKGAAIVCKVVPQKGMMSMLGSIIAAPVALLAGFMVGLYPVLMFVSNIISKPLKRLYEAMERFKEGDFEQQIQVDTKDEVGAVSEGFNRMVTDIRDLIEQNYVMALREKESELRALQAQINPHFLFNTLDCLYWRAEESGNEEIGEDIMALSQLFRLVLGQGSGVTNVGTEKDMLETYLHIQKMRFDKRLNYQIDIEEELLLCPIPKLILQPFVENAVVHGFEKSQGECMIIITGRRIGTDMQFEIKDTGDGMTPEQIDKIWNTEDTKRYSGQRIGRYAIKNVKERLALKYGEQGFLLKIDSKPGIGTMVTVRIPMENQEK